MASIGPTIASGPLQWAYQGQFLLMLLPKHSDLLENSLYSYAKSGKVLTTIFAHHSSKFVVTCAKICRGLLDWNGTLLNWPFHKTWILHEISLVKWTPSHYSSGWTPEATEEMGKLTGYYCKNCGIWIAYRSLWYTVEPNHSISIKWGDWNENHVEIYYRRFVNI